MKKLFFLLLLTSCFAHEREAIRQSLGIESQAKVEIVEDKEEKPRIQSKSIVRQACYVVRVRAVQEEVACKEFCDKDGWDDLKKAICAKDCGLKDIQSWRTVQSRCKKVGIDYSIANWIMTDPIDVKDKDDPEKVCELAGIQCSE